MGLVDTEAIILRTYNLADADKIVVCLTRKAGVVRGVAKGARRLKSRFGAGLEPFTLVALSYFEKEGRELATLQQAEIISSYFSLGGDVELISSLAYMAELVIEFSPPHEPNEKLFRMMLACLEAVARTPGALNRMVRYFEFWLLKLSGFRPDVGRCSECGEGLRDSGLVGMDASGRLQCHSCSKDAGASLSAEAYRQLMYMRRLSPEAFAGSAVENGAETDRELASFTSLVIRRVLERELRAVVLPLP